MKEGKSERRARARDIWSKIFRETFRPRTKEEYAEIFSRGLDKQRERGRGLPWLYMRALALAFLLFAAVTFFFRLTGETFDYPSALVLGGALINIPLLIFFYELYPGRDFSLVALFGVFLLGGAVSVVLSNVGYEYFYVRGGSYWISLIFTGVWEELCKALPAIVIIYLLKKRGNPLLCFVIGAAVGTGYSLWEDMGYAYYLSGSYNVSYTWLVLCCIGRGFSCVCSHAPWTAVICWMFARCKKPWRSPRFYGIAFLSMFLHYWADVPFFCEEAMWYKGGILIWIVVVAVIFYEMYYMIHTSRREFFASESGEQLSMALASPVVPDWKRISHAADITACLTCVALSLFALVFCALPAGNIYRYTVQKTFDTSAELVEYLQNGLPLQHRPDRLYDEDAEDYAQVYDGNGLSYAVQQEMDGEFVYYYFYHFSEEEVALTNIAVVIEDEVYYLRTCVVLHTSPSDYYFASTYSGQPNFDGWFPLEGLPAEEEQPDEEISDEEEEEGGDDEEEIILDVTEVVETFRYFCITGDSVDYNAEEQTFYTYTLTAITHSKIIDIALGALAALTLAGGAAAVVSLKIKARRIQNAE